MEKPRVTIGAMVFNEYDLLLLKSPKWQDKYIIPCGHVEFMETIEDAVKREVFEETGLKVHGLEFLKFIEFISPKQFHKKNLHFVGLQYCCQSNSRDVVLNEEASDYLWIPPRKALDLDLEEGTRKIVEYYVNVKDVEWRKI